MGGGGGTYCKSAEITYSVGAYIERGIASIGSAHGQKIQNTPESVRPAGQATTGGQGSAALAPEDAVGRRHSGAGHRGRSVSALPPAVEYSPPFAGRHREPLHTGHCRSAGGDKRVQRLHVT